MKNMWLNVRLFLGVMRLILSVVLVFCSTTVLAVQKLRVTDGGTYQIRISANEMTRIAIDSPGRLQDFRGSADVLEVTPDNENGEIYIRPLSDAKSLSFFVTDDNGFVYTLVATQQDVPSETIILYPAGLESSVSATGYKSSEHVKTIKDLIKSMAMARELNGFFVQALNVDIELWRESKINLSHEYIGTELVGSIYTLQNVDDEPMVLDEREFSAFGARVLAVAIREPSLAPGEVTSIFIVRKQVYDR